MNVVYDAGLLIAADRNDREIWADHRARLELGIVPVTTAPVIAQVSRSTRQVQLRRLLRGCDIVPFAPEEGHAVGALLDRADSSDVVDGHVILVAERTRALVVTSDPGDLKRLSDVLDEPVAVHNLQKRTHQRR